MSEVTGIGGIFFRATDPEGLGAWYTEVLGIDTGGSLRRQEAGLTVFAPFARDTDYFDRPEQQWMINLRVTDLDSMIDRLAATEIAVETKAEWNSEAGRFARIRDPEGNPVELWEPAGAT